MQGLFTITPSSPYIPLEFQRRHCIHTLPAGTHRRGCSLSDDLTIMLDCR